MIIRKSKRVLFHCLFGLDDAVLGGIIGVAGDLFGASMTNSATSSMNRAMQERNIEWEREQLQNKHQWEVEDLRKAGLNPILSAPNASSAVSAGTPSGQAAPVNISKSLEALANSSLMKKQFDLAEYDAETKRIHANADMLNARLAESRNPSAIGLNETQSGFYSMQIDFTRNKMMLDTAMTKANISKLQQDVINSIAEIKGRLELYKAQGQAALSSAAAAHRMADAANLQAVAAKLNADINAGNAEVYRETQRALEGKASAETQEALQRTQNEAWALERSKFDNPAVSAGTYAGSGLPGFLEMLRSGLGGSVGMSIRP